MCTLMAGFSFGGVAKAQELTLAQCPAVVQATIRNNGQGGTLNEIKLVDRDGVSLYVAEIDLGEKRDLKLYITQEGSISRSRQEIVFNQVPPAVRRAVLSVMPAGAEVTDVDMETADGTSTYVIEFPISPTRERKLTLNANGVVLSEHEKEKRQR